MLWELAQLQLRMLIAQDDIAENNFLISQGTVATFYRW